MITWIGHSILSKVLLLHSHQITHTMHYGTTSLALDLQWHWNLQRQQLYNCDTLAEPKIFQTKKIKTTTYFSPLCMSKSQQQIPQYSCTYNTSIRIKWTMRSWVQNSSGTQIYYSTCISTKMPTKALILQTCSHIHIGQEFLFIYKFCPKWRENGKFKLVIFSS